MENLRKIRQHEVVELRLGPVDEGVAAHQLDVLFTGPSGAERLVPAFASEGEWRVRYASGELGKHQFRPAADPKMPPGSSGELRITENRHPEDLLQRGPIRVAGDGIHFEHFDSTPFLWLADTWWEGFVDRLSEHDFENLAARRAAQGFSVVQIVAGLYPEMRPFAPEGRSNSGWPWDEAFLEPNPAWFDEADRRIQILLRHGLLPCIVGAWAYYLDFMSGDQLLRHWREIIARWAAYPVVWCLVGEAGIIWYEDQVWQDFTRRPDARSVTDPQLCQEVGRWSRERGQPQALGELARGLRKIDCFERPLTLHPIPYVDSWDLIDDAEPIDFWMLQTGHNSFRSLAPTIDALEEAIEHEPRKPVLNGEVCYEGSGGSSWQEIQRFLFWSHMLSGAAGHTYGAAGMWAFNTPEFDGQYSGKAPEWTEAADLPGAAHVGLGRLLLLDLPWHELEPRPELVTLHQHPGDRTLLYAAGVADSLRLVYVPSLAMSFLNDAAPIRLCGLGERSWSLDIVDLRSGSIEKQEIIAPDPDGGALLRAGHLGLTSVPSYEDWLLILRPKSCASP